MKKGLRVKTVFICIIAVLLAIILSVVAQFVWNYSIDRIPDRPQGADRELSGEGGLGRLIHEFQQAYREGDAELQKKLGDYRYIHDEIKGNYRYLNGRWDCADFKASALVRLYIENEQHLPLQIKEEIKEALLGFKYWMDEPGEDSMCYWSENHQILFSSTEYLTAQLWPDAVFADGRTAAEHKRDAARRISIWMDQRFHYGFSEYYSNNYYPEDIGPMANVIQFIDDEEIRERMKICMDLIIFDMASQNWQFEDEDGRIWNIFMSASGRMYFDNKASNRTGNRMGLYSDRILENPTVVDESGVPEWMGDGGKFFNAFSNLLDSGMYEVPEVLKLIYRDDRDEQILKSSNSLYLSELSERDLIGHDDRQIMMQWCMEAFCNPEIVDNSISYIADNRMFGNYFLNDFKLVNIWPLRVTRTLGPVSETLRPYLNGSAIERGNVYTYQNPYCVMSTTQAHLPGQFGDQHQTNILTFDEDTSVFHNHPMRSAGNRGYWMGHGRMPYSVQDGTVSLSTYHLPEKPGFLEHPVVQYTHAYFPENLFDRVVKEHMDDGYVFAEKNGAYIALIARDPLKFNCDEYYSEKRVASLEYKGRLNDSFDLVQKGSMQQFFITEVSDCRREDFDSFVARILSNPVSYDETEDLLCYESSGHRYETRFGVGFKKDGEPVNLEYERMENDYVPGGIVERESEIIEFSFGGHSLVLDWKNAVRDIR